MTVDPAAWHEDFAGLRDDLARLVGGHAPTTAEDVLKITPLVVEMLEMLDEYCDRLLVAARVGRPRVTLTQFGEMVHISRPAVQKRIYRTQDKWPELWNGELEGASCE